MEGLPLALLLLCSVTRPCKRVQFRFTQSQFCCKVDEQHAHLVIILLAPRFSDENLDERAGRMPSLEALQPCPSRPSEMTGGEGSDSFELGIALESSVLLDSSTVGVELEEPKFGLRYALY